MSLLTWILFGIVIGIGTYLIDSKARRRGVFGSILLGVSGAILGGTVVNLVFGLSIRSFDPTSLLIAMSGSLGLLFMNRAIKRI